MPDETKCHSPNQKKKSDKKVKIKKNTDVIAVMFEEVNSILKSIEKEIVAQHQGLGDVATKAYLAKDKISVENIFQQIRHTLSGLDQKLNRMSVSIHESKSQINTGLEATISILKEQEKQRIARHSQILKLKSKKVVMAFVFLLLLFLVLLTGNIYQRTELNRMSDNDIKYRYIKMIDGINSEDLSKLEDVFSCKNKQLIEKIRKKAEEHENKRR